MYYHFPGGRDELLLTAVRQAGESITELINHSAKKGDPLASLRLFVAMWKRILARTNYEAGCAVVAQAIDNRDDRPEIGGEIREIFTRWEASFTDLLIANNIPGERARRLSTVTIASIEGAVILCRVHHSPQPLDDVLCELAPLFR